ncbi:MAG: HupE/UreJ family protein [Planctomycetota bacterium]
MCRPAWAHKPSDGYVTLDLAADTPRLDVKVALEDLHHAIGLDLDGNGQINWGELKSRRYDFESYVNQHLSLRFDGDDLALPSADLLVDELSDGTYAVLRYELDSARPQRVSGEYGIMFDADPTHRGLIVIRETGGSRTFVLRPDAAAFEHSVGQTSAWTILPHAIVEGVWHILIGFDHILFLVALLLPAVLVREDGDWKPADRFGDAARNVVKIVTVFTVAHSVTLWLATSELVVLNARGVEIVIAASIIAAAAANLFHFLKVPGWLLAFGFGLLHGFGFANVLSDLGLTGSSFAVGLFGFNVGVELGQLAIVLVFLPVAFLGRRTTFYRVAVLQIGSILVALAAAYWLTERVFDLDLPLI